MSHYKIPNTLSSIDAAYIAGLIDGEGTITLTRKHRNENRQLAVTISNTEKDLLEYVLKTIGAGKITNKRTTRAHHTPSFTYALYNRQALNLLAQIHPYLKTYKVRRARLILSDYLSLTPRNGKYTDQLRLAR
ncbi:MAG: LAGLIDADG family homing endonuclease [Gammaproteobacteria bacterium]|nr:LAGLIDADG family homing endonuclease [Gammaproteobacteria bacterium]